MAPNHALRSAWPSRIADLGFRVYDLGRWCSEAGGERTELDPQGSTPLFVRVHMFPHFIFKLAGHLLWEAAKSPKSIDLDVDSADPESLLEAASLLEDQGEWNRAVELYGLAAERSHGDQNAVYAQGCIERIQEKRALAQ